MISTITLVLLVVILFNVGFATVEYYADNETQTFDKNANTTTQLGVGNTSRHNTSITVQALHHSYPTTNAPHQNPTTEFSRKSKDFYNSNLITLDPLQDHFFTGEDSLINLNDNNFSHVTSKPPEEFPWNIPASEAVEDPSNTTTYIQNYNRETLPKCPNGLTYFKDNYFRKGICFVITEPTQFPPPCLHPITVENFPQSKFYFEITSEPHWAFTSRNISHSNEDECLLVNGTTEADLILTDCTTRYPGICPYFSEENTSDVLTRYCKTRYNLTCVGYLYDSTCYCIAEAREENLPRNEFCNKLVEITNPYQNIALAELIGGRGSCWIGLNAHHGSFRWSSTNATTNYTFWSNKTDFRKLYGAIGVDGWLLEEDGTLKCAVCEIKEVDHSQVHLHVRHNKTTNTLDVKITSAGQLSLSVKCYTDGFEGPKKVDLRYTNLRNNTILVKLDFPFSISGYYWCEALRMPDFLPVYSNTIFVPSVYGREYALQLSLREPPEILSDIDVNRACAELNDDVINYSKLIKIVRLSKENQTYDALCHFILNTTEVSRAKEHEIILKHLQLLSTQFISLSNSEVCLPSITASGQETLHWPETPIGVTTIPEELCLTVDRSPVTRTCSGDFYYGGQWLEVNGTCANVTFSPTTELLNDLLTSNTTTSHDLSSSLLNITAHASTFSSLDVHLVSKALSKLSTFNELISVSNITTMIDNVMHIEPSKLRASQESLNSTDIILQSLDDVLAKTELQDGYASEVTEKLVVQISNLKATNISGLQLNKADNSFGSSEITTLQKGTSQEDIMKASFDIAMLIPQQLHDEILDCVGDKASPNLVTTVFYDDVLFNGQNHSSKHPESRVVGVTIPDFNCTINTPLQIIFNSSTSNSTRLKCASWAYGVDDAMNSIHGQWLIEDDPKSFDDSNYQVCEFTHITHFTLLILGDAKEISKGHAKALDIITAIGSGLSILGLVIIFLTAIMFKSFRSANGIVINFSIAMTAQIVLLFIAGNVAEDKVLCAVFGAVLHYIVLVQFAWMLTIAVFQYRRYVVIFSSPTSYLVLKSCACSWGIPFIPVIIIISISRDSYGENSYGLCYALGNYFVFGVLIPVALIIFVNLLVFLRIMLSIASSRKVTVHQRTNDTSLLQLRLAIMLFFLLGLTWGFGLMAAIGGGIVYSYLFCITATLQGFVLFLYFIVLNDKTRSLWTNMTMCNCKEKSNEYVVNSDSAGTAMIRRPKATTSADTNTSSTASEVLQKYKNRRSTEFS